MESSLKSRVYIVTGGAAGIGLGITKLLLSYGAYVYSTDLEKTPPSRLAALPQDRLVYFQGNVKDRKRSHEIVSSIVDQHGRVDGLINCAGVCPLEGEMPGDDLYDHCFDVNVRGCWNMGIEALKVMKAQKSGNIINIGSISSTKGVGRLPLYTATKHALAGLTKTWALDFAKYGVRVNMIGPGAVDTQMARSPLKTVMGPIFGADKSEDELLEHVIATIPLGRIGQPEDVANACAFFLSDLSSFITGQILMVSGGQ